jgi:hypothetical protein
VDIKLSEIESITTIRRRRKIIKLKTIKEIKNTLL